MTTFCNRLRDHLAEACTYNLTLCWDFYCNYAPCLGHTKRTCRCAASKGGMVSAKSLDDGGSGEAIAVPGPMALKEEGAGGDGDAISDVRTRFATRHAGADTRAQQ